MRLTRLQARLAFVESIHKRIRRLRESAGLSQEQLAAEVGVKYQSVQEWEREGGTAPSRKRQQKVADALGVTIHELMTGLKPPESKPTSDEEAPQKIESAEIDRLIRAYAWLSEEEQAELLKDLESKAVTNKAFMKQMKNRLRLKTDAEMLDHLQRTGALDAEGKVSRPRRPAPRPKSGRDAGTAMDDFLGDDT